MTPIHRLDEIHAVRKQLRGMKRIRREVDQLQRRIGTVSIPEQPPTAPALSSGPFEYDYLIDKKWENIGPEGQDRLTFHGHTYKVFSSLSRAVTDANVNRQATLQSSSFMLVGTGVEGGSPSVHYVEDTQISLNPPNGGSYLIYGSGPDSVTIEGTMTSGDLFNIPTQVNDSVIGIFGIELRTNEAIDLISGGGSTRVLIDNVWLRPNNSSAAAINPGNAGIGWNISNTNIEGVGAAILGGTLYSVRLNTCYVATTIGIDLTNDAQFYGTLVRFNCTTADVNIGATAGSLAFVVDNCEFNKGIRFNSGAALCAFRTFVVGDCIFILGNGEVGIDYSLCTGASSLIAAESHSLVGNSFSGSGTAEGIRGGLAATNGPRHVAVVANSFEGFAADSEIIDMARDADGNEIAHNVTDSGATLPDTGTGHGGSSISSIVTKTGAYTATDFDVVIICDAASGAFTITLPTAVGRKGKLFDIKKVDATANAITVDGDGTETIDGALTQVIAMQYNAIQIVSDGSNWHIL